MPHHIAFLRAVNVAPRWLKMAELRSHLAALGHDEVASHIQSGNLRLADAESDPQRVAERLEGELAAYAGFDVPCMVFTAAEVLDLHAAVLATPPLLESPGRRYVAFARHPIPDAGRTGVEGWTGAGERARVIADRAILLELGLDFHKARLPGARLERLATVPLTARDLNVVTAITEKWGTT